VTRRLLLLQQGSGQGWVVVALCLLLVLRLVTCRA
jgi:hypothetical protein